MKKLLLISALAAVSASGCNRQDGDRLARVGRKVTDKVQGLVPQRSPFGTGVSLGRNPGLEERVRERFKSDRFLAPQPIEITVEGNTVRLKGTVELQVLKQRAGEIADSTVGVEKVIDEIVVTDG